MVLYLAGGGGGHHHGPWTGHHHRVAGGPRQPGHQGGGGAGGRGQAHLCARGQRQPEDAVISSTKKFFLKSFTAYLLLFSLSKFLDLLLTSRLGSSCSSTPPRQSTSSLLSTGTPRVDRSSVCDEEKELVSAAWSSQGRFA